MKNLLTAWTETEEQKPAPINFTKPLPRAEDATKRRCKYLALHGSKYLNGAKNLRQSLCKRSKPWRGSVKAVGGKNGGIKSAARQDQ
jgi:hypothetical protein